MAGPICQLCFVHRCKNRRQNVNAALFFARISGPRLDCLAPETTFPLYAAVITAVYLLRRGIMGWILDLLFIVVGATFRCIMCFGV